MRTRPRSLWPREHGAYAELGFPSLSAILCGSPTPPAILFFVAFWLGFLASEPVAVLLGHRGSAAQRNEAARARVRAVCLLSLSGLLLLGACLLSPSLAALSLLGPIAAACVMALLIFVFRRTGLTTDLLAALTFSACAIPVGLAAEVSPASVFTLFAVWTLAYSQSSLAVVGVVAAAAPSRRRGRDVDLSNTPGQGPSDSNRANEVQRPADTTRKVYKLATNLTVIVSIMVLCVLVWLGRVPLVAPIALAPMSAAVLALNAMAPHPRSLRRIGWALVVGSSLVLATLVWGLR